MADAQEIVHEVGLEVTRVSFDYALTFLIEDSSRIVVETPFDLILDGVTMSVDPESARAVAPSVLALLHSTVSRLIVRDPGILTVEFLGGDRMVVPLSNDYESWTVYSDTTGIGGLVCPPGGLDLALVTWN
jgi:hypothetical protein